MKISAIINTLNEEENIENLLKTIQWIDEIIIVDMYSEDKTVEIAKKYTDKIYFHERLGYADPARQFALDKTTNKWILMLDADEIVPVALKDELIKIAKEDIYDVVYLPRHTFYLSETLDIRLFNQLDLQPRFFKKNKMGFSNKIHSFYDLNENIKVFKLKDSNKSIIHLSDNLHGEESYFAESIIKQDHYTTIELENNLENIKNQRFLISIFYYFFIFLKEYFLSQFSKKPRFQNILFSLGSVYYVGLFYSKKELYKKYGNLEFSENIEKYYQNIADDVAEDYEKE